jgi:hypothetical protein
MKNIISKLVVISSFAFVASGAFASGFKCDGTEGYAVRLYNHLDATRLPAALIVSHSEATPTTLLKAYDEEIRKHNKANTVQYVVDGGQMSAETVILQIAFKEGQESIAAGETIPGQLILVGGNGGKEVHQLDCARYLKGE